MTRIFSPPPDPELRAPKSKAPPGAWDTHFHVIGPQAIYPLHPGRAIDIPDAPYEALLAMHDTLGISRGLLVQSGLHYWDYHQLVHLLTLARERWRGVAIVHDSVTDGELALLDNVGVVGARFYPGISPLDQRQLARVHEIGWSAHVLIRGEAQALAARQLLRETRGPIVIEHAGWQDPADGIEGAGFRVMRELLDTGRCWLKLSPRMSNCAELPFSDTLPMIEYLIDRAPDRLFWGSDWPHPNYFHPMPNDADLFDLLTLWAPDEGVRKRILVDNPADFFDR